MIGLEDSTALIIGTARNCAEGLAATLPRLGRLTSTFGRADFVLAANDITDTTGSLLREWARTRDDVHLIDFDGLVDNVPKRTARLATIRNLCLSALRHDSDGSSRYDFLIVADLDGVNANLVDDPVFSAVINKAPSDWAALFANQRQVYYDIWALRHPVWSPDDCWAHVAKASRRRFNRKSATEAALDRHVYGRQIHIAPNHAPIAVDSAFGGFGIYRSSFLGGALYRGLTPSGEEVCEHVFFNASVKRNGGALYIAPGLLNDTPAEHIR